ncbi:MAG: hypothetical protein A3H98_09635 [Bacteroidetes bacterium RIFCSPLOWO2_02_FULL_36_8]|nr:MAG: hypothetical protein A3H98_09635 [Bacteroidetes bacterium RIFCSPLOWO2_02_FULL_36_8]OFY69288.1 MAG: hypothetical protein A3G23_02360 [Bacteroidetes bacterium RIFCSPLOWO2_12_FULL_37_12]
MSTEQTPQKSSKKGIFILFIILLLILNALQLWVNISHKKDIEQKTEIIDNAKKEFDELSGVKKQLDQKVDSLDFSNSQMKFEIESKKVELEEKEKEIRNLLAKQKRNLSEIATLKEKLSEYKNLLSERDEQISRLSKENSELKKANEELTTQVATLDENVKTLKVEKEDLFKKGSVLIPGKMAISAISKNGKERKDQDYYRVKHLDKVKICFNLADNKVASQGSKSFFVRVIDPSGACLPQTNGTNVFEMEGKQVLFTLKEDFTFDNSGQKICILWQNEAGFKPGMHTINIYSEGVKVAEEKLMVKKNLF